MFQRYNEKTKTFLLMKSVADCPLSDLCLLAIQIRSGYSNDICCLRQLPWIQRRQQHFDFSAFSFVYININLPCNQSINSVFPLYVLFNETSLQEACLASLWSKQWLDSYHLSFLRRMVIRSNTYRGLLRTVMQQDDIPCGTIETSSLRHFSLSSNLKVNLC